MTEAATSIFMNWDASGRIRHKISGITLPRPRNDRDVWVLAPSAPLFVANQIGAMRPSHGLILCSQVLGMMQDDNYVLSPINSALQSARLDYLYNRDASLSVKFFPAHAPDANNDSLEEGVRQLVTNHFYMVMAHFVESRQSSIKFHSATVIQLYFTFLEDAIEARLVRPGNDQWRVEFSRLSSSIVNVVSKNYLAVDPEEEEWVAEQNRVLPSTLRQLTTRGKQIGKKLGFR